MKQTVTITTKWGTYPIHRNWLVDPRTLKNWSEKRGPD